MKSYKRNNKDKIDLSVVNGLLARTYLNTGEWLKAADAANTARTGYTFMPAEKYSEGFNDIGNLSGFGDMDKRKSNQVKVMHSTIWMYLLPVVTIIVLWQTRSLKIYLIQMI